MRIEQVKQSLPALLRTNVVPCLWGYQGVGKTAIVGQIAKDLGVGLVKLNLATQEIGDLIGLLTHAGVDKNGSPIVSHAKPSWFPVDGEGIIFLDEINRAHPDVIQAMYPFILEGVMHKHELPRTGPKIGGWKIVAASNYQTSEFNTTDVSDTAWMSRFCHINFDPTHDEFVRYAESKGASDVADFIAEHKELLESRGRERQDFKVTPDRRSWLSMIAKLDKESMDEDTRMEVYSGIVGNVAASRYLTFKKNPERRMRLHHITSDYSKVRERVLLLNSKKETRFDALAAPIRELEDKAGKNEFNPTDSEIENLRDYFLDIPLELLAQSQKKLSRLRFPGVDKLLNDPVFVKKLLK